MRILHAALVAAAVSAVAAGAGLAVLAARERRVDRDEAARIWWCPARSLTGGPPYVFRGGDEYGNRTIACRVPFGMVIVATSVPLRRRLLDLHADPDWT